MADLNTFINIGANTANFVGDITATNLGNISAVDLNGNANTVLAGDGTWANTISLAGNITSGNLISNQDVFATGVLTLSQSFVSNTDVTMRIFADGDSSYIQVGNGVGGSTGNVAFAPYFDGTGAVVINTGSGNISTVGNITSANSVVGSDLRSTFSSGNEGGQIDLATAAANTTLAGTSVTVDIFQNRFRIFESGGAFRGAYLDISTCGNAVATPLLNRTSRIAAANTKVTFNNITAQVGGSPTRLYIGAATSNLQVAGTSQTMSSGSIAISSWINVPISTGAGNEFAMSGALTANGDTAVLNITDQTAGTGTWRVTGLIANTASNLYSITIEQIA